MKQMEKRERNRRPATKQMVAKSMVKSWNEGGLEDIACTRIYVGAIKNDGGGNGGNS